TARPDFALKGQIGNRLESVVGKSQAYVFEFEESLILTHESVFRFRQDAHQRAFVEIAQHAHDRQPADELRNQPVADQIGGLRLLEYLDIAPRGRGRLRIRMKPERLLPHATLDNLFQPHKGPAADEQDVCRIDWGELLMRVLAPALGRNVGDRAFQNLQQCLLHALAGNVPCDRGILVLLRNLVDLVYVYDALLGFLDVTVGGLQELQDDVFDVFTDVARLSERGGIDDGKRYIQHPRERLRQERLAGPGRPDQQDVRLGEFHVARLPVQENPLVMV